MSSLMLDGPGVRVFWSAFDPLDLASDSIDPLGFTAGYISLADLLLPGFTTITTVPRYASVLCYALQRARESAGDDVASLSARRRQKIEVIQRVERAWALSCGFAEREVGESAVDGLRGVRAVHRWLAANGEKEKISIGFALLSNQVRYGGIGAYGTFLEAMHLADTATLTLRPLGEELAEAFPRPDSFRLAVEDDGLRLSVETLGAWGRLAHTGDLSSAEAEVLRRALHGGQEAELDDACRWEMLRLIQACCRRADLDEPTLLAACLAKLSSNRRADNELNSRVTARLAVALNLIEPYEQMYQAALFIFDAIRAAATAAGGYAPLVDVAQTAAVVAAHDALTEAASSFLNRLGASTHAPGLDSTAESLREFGLLEFAKTAASSSDSTALCHEILLRHRRVQEGKFDGGQSKAPWVRMEAGGSTGAAARLTQQRFGLEMAQLPDAWENMPRHPYRTRGARQFIRLCEIK